MHTDVTIAALIQGLQVRMASGDPQVVPTSITEDSRAVLPGALFVARVGTRSDGRRFIADAIEKGAVAILHDGSGEIPAGVATLLADDVARESAIIAERFHGSPSSALSLIGVTGTNGKTTVATLLAQLLNHASVRCGLIGTVSVDDGTGPKPATLTTPPAITLSSTLATMVANGCKAGAMEVSSHALSQSRTSGLNFTVGIFTNLTGDHLDYHGSMDEYAAAKARLFEHLGPGATAIVNTDDSASERMVRDFTGAQIWRTTTRGNDTAEFSAHVLAMHARSTQARVWTPHDAFEINLPLIGEHNVHNALQAFTAACAAGVDIDLAREALEACAAPAGRLEPVRIDGAVGPTVLVDYAHTDDALANVLQAVRPAVPPDGRLWVVFGCGGDRDRTKRPRMAATAARFADQIVITSDNPRTEDPHDILDDILPGIPSDRSSDATLEVDRRSAIHSAILAATETDVVVIAGKGHEDYQIIGEQRLPFDDRIVAREALERRQQMVEVAS